MLKKIRNMETKVQAVIIVCGSNRNMSVGQCCRSVPNESDWR